jgi:hypothetical protein
MNQRIVNQISKIVYKQFPEIRGSRPRIMTQPQPKSMNLEASYILTYRAITKVPGGKRFPRQVRVVANPKGKILRVSTSR